MAQSFANQMGNIGALVTGIVSAVLFTLLLVVGNTMSQSVRERIGELAVLKTLGFKHHQDVVVKPDSPSLRGAIKRVRHLVKVTPVKE